MTQTLISVIIPTLNGEDQIGALLKGLQSQTLPSEIIVIDSSSSDNTERIARSCGVKTRVIKREEYDHGGTRARAAKETQGDILVYMTQDVLPCNNHALENLIKPFSDNRIGATYGRQMPYADASPFGAHSRLFNYPEGSFAKRIEDKERFKIKTPFLSNAFAAYRKKALEEIGGFREGLISTEDTYAGAKLLLAGYHIEYVSDALVYHSHDYTVLQEFRRYFDIGVFHRKEPWILAEFGKATGEGRSYLRSEWAYLLNKKKYLLLPEFFVRNCFKYIGYHLGLHHEKIPKYMIRSLSRNRQWWKKRL